MKRFKLTAFICAAALVLSCMAAVLAADDTEERDPVTITIVHTPEPTEYAEEATENGLTYTYKEIEGGMRIEITKIDTTDVVIPESVNDKPVIYVSALSINKAKRKYETLYIPDTVQYFIGFGSNPYLKSVRLPAGISKIENNQFDGCTALESIDIPSNVKKIDREAFAGCSSLKNVTFHEGLINIGELAFRDCDIQNLNLPSTVTTIGRGAFIRNYNMSYVNLPEQIETIETLAFQHCAFESVTIPSTIGYIGENAFKCENLKEVKGLTKNQVIKFWSAFGGAPIQESLTSEDEPFLMDDSGTLVAYTGSEKNVEIPEGVKVIAKSTFMGSDIESVKFPSTLKTIETLAFYQCEHLTSITIPANVNEIETLAFSNCMRLKDITFEYSDELLLLGSSAFQGTAVTEDTLITNNRRYSNKDTAFANTALDPDGSIMLPEADTEPTASPTAAPTAKPTEEPKSVLTVTTGAEPVIDIDGEAVTFTDAKPFIDENDRTMIPIRAVAEVLECEVEWNESAREVSLSKDGTEVLIKIDDRNMIVNDKTVEMDTNAVIINDRTYIPLRFAGEALGFTVKWK